MTSKVAGLGPTELIIIGVVLLGMTMVVVTSAVVAVFIVRSMGRKRSSGQGAPDGGDYN